MDDGMARGSQEMSNDACDIQHVEEMGSDEPHSVPTEPTEGPDEASTLHSEQMDADGAAENGSKDEQGANEAAGGERMDQEMTGGDNEKRLESAKTEEERRDKVKPTSHCRRHKNALALRKKGQVTIKTPYSSTLKRLKANEQIKELTEEDYVSCLENIIERDYFPDLTKLRYINAIAEAKAAGNTHMAQVLSERLRRVEEGELDETDVELKTLKEERVVVNLGKDGLKLNEFHRIFTSEDNRNFERLTKSDIEKSIQKTKWIEESEYKHNLALAEIRKDTELGIRSKSTASNKAVARNSLMFYPDGEIPSAPSEVRILPKNTSLNVEERMKELEDLQMEKRNELKRIAENEEVANLVVADGVAKHRDVAHLHHSTNYGYVHTPKIVAGQANTPLFTWGTIGDVEAIPSTPLTAGKGSIGQDGFRVPDAVPRELLADKLHKRLNRKHAKTPLTSSGNPNTPLIVQKLIAKHTKNVDMQLRDSYSGHKRGPRSSSVASSHRRP